MDDHAGSGAGAGENTPRRLDVRVAGPALAAGAVSLGLVLIGSCGLGQHEVYVTPPPLNADLQSAPTGLLTSPSGSTTAAVHIPPSPSWRVAVDPPPRRTISGAPGTTTSRDETSSPAPYAGPSETTRTTTSGSFDESRTTTTRPRPTTTTRRTPTDTTPHPIVTEATTSPTPTPESEQAPDFYDEN
ncbi:hypothetical protein [Nocardia sp. BMG51109]|uniref:hypothetical protein n=1 Tax=Nocardia sp. BMG51109 TaxID=1056816 RepID=UPI0004663102|nr:hypothetical protein [Nocardia sp. BMG51109]